MYGPEARVFEVPLVIKSPGYGWSENTAIRPPSLMIVVVTVTFSQPLKAVCSFLLQWLLLRGPTICHFSISIVFSLYLPLCTWYLVSVTSHVWCDTLPVTMGWWPILKHLTYYCFTTSLLIHRLLLGFHGVCLTSSVCPPPPSLAHCLASLCRILSHFSRLNFSFR